MRDVGDHLRTQAINRSLSLQDASDADRFGRSAFNRYYYAAFLAARQLVIHIEGQPLSIGHKSLPEYLLGNIQRQITKALDRSLRTHVINDQEYGRYKATSTAALKKIADILTNGYGIRVQCDYNTTPPVFINKTDISIGGISGSDAQRWSRDVEQAATAVQRAWEEGHG